jgi:hypothetical protein
MRQIACEIFPRAINSGIERDIFGTTAALLA